MSPQAHTILHMSDGSHLYLTAALPELHESLNRSEISMLSEVASPDDHPVSVLINRRHVIKVAEYEYKPLVNTSLTAGQVSEASSPDPHPGFERPSVPKDA